MTGVTLWGTLLTCLVVACVSLAAVTISRRAAPVQANTVESSPPEEAQQVPPEEEDEAGRKAAAELLKARDETVEALRAGRPAPYR